MYLVNFYNNGRDIREATKNATGGRVVGTDYYFKEQISWSDITSGNVAFRYYESGFIFDACANTAFFDKQIEKQELAYLNTKIVEMWSKILNPTIHFKIGNFQQLPYVKEKENKSGQLADEDIEISKEDWDSFETSWDFKKHPLI